MERHVAYRISTQTCLHQSAASCQSCRRTGVHCSSWLGVVVMLWQQHTHCTSFMLTCKSWTCGWQRPSSVWAHQNFLLPVQRQRPCWNCTRNARYDICLAKPQNLYVATGIVIGTFCCTASLLLLV